MWSPIAKPGQQAIVNLPECHESISCCLCCMVCECVVVSQAWVSVKTETWVCLTFVLWLAIAGNPSTSQSKKTIKQRFLKLLPCCKPSAAPSISQSKCSFTLYTHLPLRWHTHTHVPAWICHVHTFTETDTTMHKPVGSDLVLYFVIWPVLCCFLGHWTCVFLCMCICVTYDRMGYILWRHWWNDYGMRKIVSFCIFKVNGHILLYVRNPSTE